MEASSRKILLIAPPYNRLYKETYSLDRYPLALGYLAAVICERSPWDVTAYNADFTPDSEPEQMRYLSGKGFDNYLKNLNDPGFPIWKEIEQTIRDYRPSVVGLSCMTQNSAGALNIARIAKEIDPNILVVIGGPHATMIRAEVLGCSNIDIGVVGEGEETIVELLDAIDNRKELDDVRGLIFRKEGRTVETPPRGLIDDLDSLPFPHVCAPKVLKDFDKYPPHAFRRIFAIRGCPFDCIFCGSRYLWGRKARYRSVENIIEEVKSLRESGVKAVTFDDDSFGLKEPFLISLCEKMKTECPGTTWTCEMHVKSVNEKTASAMKDAGCTRITLGIESGNNEILEKIRKQITIEEALEAAKIIKRHGIELGAFFMAGFPWETEESMKDTIEAMKAIECDNLVHSIFTPYKGSEAFEVCKEMGLIEDNYEFSLYNHHSPMNNFCNIPQDRFRELSSEMERLTDRNNFLYKVRELFSFRTLGKIRRYGLKKTAEKGLRILKAGFGK